MTTGAWAQTTADPVALTSVCTGTQGANLFPDGDFGTGVPNNAPNAPSGVPSSDYTYATVNSLQPSYYTATKSTVGAPCWFAQVTEPTNAGGYFLFIDAKIPPRSEERRVGKECCSWCRSRGSPDH